MIYKIFEVNYEKFEKKMKWATNKIKKIENGFLTYSIVGEEFVKYRKMNFKVLHVDIRAETPCINGWEFSATLCHLSSGDNVINILPTFEPDVPLKYFKAQSITCEHCNSKRYRRDTFLLYNVEEKTFKQVGRQCLKDFLGYINPKHYAEMATFISGLQDDNVEDLDEKEDFGGYRTRSYLQVREWLAMTKAVVNLFGVYLSKSKAEHYSDCTEAKVFEQFDDWHKTIKYLRNLGIKIDEVPEEDYNFADDAIKYLQTLEVKNTYEGNLKSLASSDYCEYRFSGYVTSIVPYFQKHLDYIAKKENKVNNGSKNSITRVSEHVGVEGKRQDFELLVTKVIAFEGFYGMSYFNLMEDLKGNSFIWKTSKSLEENNKYLLKGTVKAHTEFKEKKQTELTRCKILKEFGNDETPITPAKQVAG